MKYRPALTAVCTQFSFSSMKNSQWISCFSKWRRTYPHSQTRYICLKCANYKNYSERSAHWHIPHWCLNIQLAKNQPIIFSQLLPKYGRLISLAVEHIRRHPKSTGCPQTQRVPEIYFLCMLDKFEYMCAETCFSTTKYLGFQYMLREMVTMSPIKFTPSQLH